MTTLLLILFSFLAFTPIVNVKTFVKIFIDLVMIKSILWSPFIALEYYETVFENVYYDV